MNPTTWLHISALQRSRYTSVTYSVMCNVLPCVFRLQVIQYPKRQMVESRPKLSVRDTDFAQSLRNQLRTVRSGWVGKKNVVKKECIFRRKIPVVHFFYSLGIKNGHESWKKKTFIHFVVYIEKYKK